MPTGKKFWRYRYSKDGKRAWHTIGEYPTVSLKDARELRDAAKKNLFLSIPADGIQEAVYSHETVFGEVAEEWLQRLEQRLTSEKERQTARNRIKNHVLPYLADRPIKEILPTEILSVIRQIEDRGSMEVAHRVYQGIGRIFRYAVSCGLCERDPSADIKGALSPPTGKHFSAITDVEQIGGLLRAIDSYPGIVTRYAMQLSALTFCRPGEIRHCEWREINFKTMEWRIDAAKMKMRRDHIVPLAKQAVDILQRAERISGGGRYVFPSARTPDGSRAMSEIAVLAALRRMGYTKEEMTAHGFRAMASTLLYEHNWPSEVIELQLAHSEKNKVKAAYNRAQFLDKRREMMQWWADFLDELREVTSQ
jgi:integrase